MGWAIISTAQYERRAVKFFRRNPKILAQYQKALELLEVNPYHPSLRLHALHGKLEGLHSVSINMSCRITLELLVSDEEIVLINIGTHGSHASGRTKPWSDLDLALIGPEPICLSILGQLREAFECLIRN